MIPDHGTVAAAMQHVVDCLPDGVELPMWVEDEVNHIFTMFNADLSRVLTGVFVLGYIAAGKDWDCPLREVLA